MIGWGFTVLSLLLNLLFLLVPGAYLGNKAVNCFWFNIPHACNSYIDITLICVSGNCRLHLFSRSQKRLIHNIQLYFGASFEDLNLVFLFSCVNSSSSPASGFSLWMIPQPHPPPFRCSTATHQGPPGVKPHYTIASFCSSASAPLGIILQNTYSQPGEVTALLSHHPSLTAMIREGPLLRLRSGINSLLDG